MEIEMLDEARFLFKFDKSCQTSPKLSSSTPRKQKLKKRLGNLSRINHRLTAKNLKLNATKAAFLELCDKFLSNELALFVKGQMQLTDRQKKNYTKEYKQFALGVYFSGPRAYRHLSQTFKLPSKRTLERITEKWPACSGLNDFVFEAMKIKIRSFTTKEKECILAMDEMSIKSHLAFDKRVDKILGFNDVGSSTRKSTPATNALVVMVKGIMSKWKQPLCFYFVDSNCSAKSLYSILGEIVTRISELGLTLRGVVSDQGSNFSSLAKLLGIDRNKSTFVINDKTLFYIFDAPHLIKSIRNHFITKRYEWDGQHTDFSYVKNIYEFFKERNLKLTWKLTKSHISPSPFEKMKVKYASQLLSASTAAAIGTFIVAGTLPTAALGTMSFVEKFDEIFDFLNSSSKFSPKKTKCAYIASMEQREFIRNTIEFLKSLKVFGKSKKTGKVVDVTSTLRCIEGLIVTLNSVMQLFDVLKEEGHEYLLTRSLNQDCLEHFFSAMRFEGGWCRNPSALQFSRQFKKKFATKFLQHSTGSNCEQENDFFSLLENQPTNPPGSERFLPKLESESYENCVIINEAIDNFNVPDKNALNYFCGYLLSKCLKIHPKCDLCEKMKVIGCGKNSTFITLKKYNDSRDALFSTCASLTAYIESMDTIFVKYFNKICSKSNVSKSMEKLLLRIKFTPQCNSFPAEYLRKLFIRCRIYFSLRFYNMKITEQKKSKVKKPIPKLLTLCNL